MFHECYDQTPTKLLGLLLILPGQTQFSAKTTSKRTENRWKTRNPTYPMKARPRRKILGKTAGLKMYKRNLSLNDAFQQPQVHGTGTGYKALTYTLGLGGGLVQPHTL